MGRTQRYNPSTDRISADPVEVPVCWDCRRHALQSHGEAIAVATALLLGIICTGLGAYYVSRRDDGVTRGMLLLGIAGLTATACWIIALHRRGKRERLAGHNPRMALSVTQARTLLHTTNSILADELVTLNPGARRLDGKPGLPEARALRHRPRGGPKDPRPGG
jgi:hypothetical protein